MDIKAFSLCCTYAESGTTDTFLFKQYIEWFLASPKARRFFYLALVYYTFCFFSKNRMIPQTTFVLTFWPHIISELGGVTRIEVFCSFIRRIENKTMNIKQTRNSALLFSSLRLRIRLTFGFMYPNKFWLLLFETLYLPMLESEEKIFFLKTLHL